MEASKIVLICCMVLSTQMIPRIREEKLPHRKCGKCPTLSKRRRLCLSFIWISSTIVIPRTREEKFLLGRNVEKVKHRRSIKDCANPSLGIKHPNDSKNSRGEVRIPWMCGKVSTSWKLRRLCRSVVG